MVNLYEKVKTDNQKILNSGFTAVAVLTNSSTIPASQSIQIHYTDVGLDIDPENDLPIVGRKVGVSFHIGDITIEKEKENFESWQLEFTNNKGETVKGVLNNIMQDRTLNMVTSTLRLK